MLDFFSKNLAALTLMTFMASTSCVVIALVAYVSTFDWNIIWLIEYSDVSTVFREGRARAATRLLPGRRR
jgi:hypothetical protein